MKRSILVVFALTAFLAVEPQTTAVAQTSDYVVIVHSDNPRTSLSKNQASLFFLKKRKRWPDSNLDIEPVDQSGDSQVRQALSRDVHSRSVSAIKNYWQKQIFSGRNTPPPELSTDQEVIAWVSSRPGAIGYVSPRARLNGVKTLTLTN